MLSALLEIAHPVTSDLELPAAALARGSARERREGLDLVDRHELDVPALREAVHAAAAPPEADVAGRAQALLAVRGW